MFDNTRSEELATLDDQAPPGEPRLVLGIVIVVLLLAIGALVVGWTGLATTVPVVMPGPA